MRKAGNSAARAKASGMSRTVQVTKFQENVYAALLEVPRGKVVSYGELAKAIGCGSPRAVGQALRKNPFAPRIPCHRVVATDGSLGGFCGRRETATLARKRALLEAEGVAFGVDGRISAAYFFHFTT